uniref:Uncharacterized protein LOC102800896 n=1 Tax=Saccoglossus kowalevskii TaxID=10224 RepID=A0ABM0MSA9_SACKO|nr:PREDICTED: uncharacterized protein LOC102800896 [Saccoglossus kowalevskii]
MKSRWIGPAQPLRAVPTPPRYSPLMSVPQQEHTVSRCQYQRWLAAPFPRKEWWSEACPPQYYHTEELTSAPTIVNPTDDKLPQGKILSPVHNQGKSDNTCVGLQTGIAKWQDEHVLCAAKTSLGGPQKPGNSDGPKHDIQTVVGCADSTATENKTERVSDLLTWSLTISKAFRSTEEVTKKTKHVSVLKGAVSQKSSTSECLKSVEKSNTSDESNGAKGKAEVMSSFLQSKLDEICGMMKKNNYMPPKKMDDFQNDIDRVVSALAMLVLVKESKTTLQKHHMRCLAASLFLTCDTIQECKHMKKAIEENFFDTDIFPKASSLLGPYFNIYPKLSRALIYPINPYSDFTVQFFKSNHKLPVYICYARLLKDISDSKYHLSQKCCSILELFDEMNMKSVSEETQSENEHTLLMNEMRTHAYKVAKELVIAVAKEKKLEMEKILIVAKFFVSEVNMTKLLLERSGSNGEKLTTDELMEDIKKVSSLLGISMSCDLPNERIGLKRELMKWSELAKVAFIENKLQETWIESTLSVLKKCIEKANTDTTINIYQWANDDKISKHIQELVTQIIYTILEDYKPSSERKPILQLKSDNLERYTQLISQFIIRLWSKLRGKKDDDKFKLLLQEKAWPRCIELSLDVNVSPEAATCLKDAKTLIQHGIEDLYKCDVEMGSITCMLKNETEFIMFCESIHKDEQYTKSAEIPNIEDIHKCITAKKTEYEMLQNFKHSLKLCSEMLSKLNKEVVIPAEVNARNTDYKRVQSYIQRLSNDIFNGTISISQLQILVHHKDAFAKLWKTADKYQGTDECKITVEDMTKCITTREKEVKALLHFKSKVQLVIGLFQKSNHDFTVLHRILETLEDPQSHICDMFDVKVFDKLSESPFITNSHTLDENNSFPQLPKSVIIMINEIPCSKLVVQMFDDTNKYVQTAPPSLNMPTTSIQSPESIQSITENVIPTATISSELVQEMSTENVEDQVTTTSFDVEAVDRLATEVWPYVKSRLKKLKDEISSHNILLSDVHYYFRAYQHNINSLHDQLVPIVGKQGEKEEIAKFCATVHDYFSLEEVKKAAAVVKKCKDALEVNGDFTSITIIDEQDTKREGKYLKSINDSVVDTRNVLRTFTDERLECLQTFTMCKEIISWSIEGLREAQPRTFTCIEETKGCPWSI